MNGNNILDESSGSGDDDDDTLSGAKLDILAFWYSKRFEAVTLLELLGVYAKKFYLIGHLLENLTKGLPTTQNEWARMEDIVSDEFAGALKQDLEFIIKHCKEIHLYNVARYAQGFLDKGTEKMTYRGMERMLQGLQERMEENLDSVYFKHVPKDQYFLHRSPFPFGQKVLDQFPSAAYDTEEAAKSFALDRYTACVMHLMRVCEVGLKAYGTSLNVTAQIRSAQADWGTILRIANDEIQKLNKSGDPTWTPDKRRFFEDTHAHFHAVRVAFRNRSMHADQQYDYVRAKEIYTAVRVWVRSMAEHLDDLGNFTP